MKVEIDFRHCSPAMQFSEIDYNTVSITFSDYDNETIVLVFPIAKLQKLFNEGYGKGVLKRKNVIGI